MKLLLGTTLSLTALLSLSLVGTASSPSPADAGALRSQAGLQQWQAAHGQDWRLINDQESGYGRFLFGGSTEPATVPVDSVDFALLARRAVEDTVEIHGIDAATLVQDKVMFLPLASVGSSDKMTARFLQSIGGVPVIGGTVNVLLDMRGGVLSVDTKAIPAVSFAATTPAFGQARAADIARELFRQDTGLPATRVEAPVLRFERVLVDKAVAARLVWVAEVHFDELNVEPEGYVYRIDARTGALSSRINAVHNDVSGRVEAWATPGAYPDNASNPEVLTDMPHMTVSSPQGNAVTDVNGNFTIVGATAPVNATVTFNGTYTTTNNNATSDYTQTQSLSSASGNVITMNAATTEYYTAEANSFNWINLMREWTRSVNPGDPTSDFNATSNVNLSSTCNAFYNGSSVNFYSSGGGCPNTSFSSVVLHEMGHWLNDLYGSGNGSDGFGEGNADNFSTYILDDPIIGHDFFGPGTNVRDATNTRTFCGDGNEGCYGQVHTDGEVLMGACWKVRERLKTAHGTVAGGAIADNLLNAWLNAYDDTMIQTIIEIHWLTLDDDNGNINDGTPNYPHIDGGFRDQAFPGFDLSFVSISNVTELPTTPDETGPYTVTADMFAVFNPPMASQDLYYRVGGGSWTQVPMTLFAGNTYYADIPGQASPTIVEYYVEAFDNLSNSNTYPSGGAASPLEFFVGVEQRFFFDDFEGGVGGWTRTGSSNDWQHTSEVGAPNATYGKAGDPTSAYSGTNVWGNDLGQGSDDGEYEDYVSSISLLSPIIDCSAATGATLRFQRWLRIERGIYDHGNFLVNGTQLWTNDASNNLLDTSWVAMEFDISALADGNPSVQLQWVLDTDYSVTYGGWNIDDVEIISFVATIPAGAVSRNGSGTNPNILTNTSLPLIGGTWGGQIDAGSIGGTGQTIAFVYQRSLPGASSPWGEILLDVSSPMVAINVSGVSGGLSNHFIGIPNDTGLHGLTASVQGYVTMGASPGVLTNALDLTLGY